MTKPKGVPVRDLWWDGDDLMVEYADGRVERYVDATVVDAGCSFDEGQTGVKAEPLPVVYERTKVK